MHVWHNKVISNFPLTGKHLRPILFQICNSWHRQENCFSFIWLYLSHNQCWLHFESLSNIQCDHTISYHSCWGYIGSQQTDQASQQTIKLTHSVLLFVSFFNYHTLFLPRSPSPSLSLLFSLVPLNVCTHVHTHTHTCINKAHNVNTLFQWNTLHIFSHHTCTYSLLFDFFLHMPTYKGIIQ